jgi:phosphoenolpyruvate synthase/pyruvate phosphate dikinase
MKIVWFDQQAYADEIGGKGFRLCRLAQAALPVPKGFCVTVSGMETLRPVDIEAALAQMGSKSVAVRSSAIEEDSGIASFAGIYVSRLNLSSVEEIVDALHEIRRSASSPAAVAYRLKRGITAETRMAAVVQEFLNPEASGVLFMTDPLEGTRRIVVEGAWGIGESVVGGRVTPDRWVLSPKGDLISSTISDKDVATVAGQNGVTEIEVDSCRRRRPCLEEVSLLDLFQLAIACENLFGGPQDIEWALALNRIWLLQSRPITRAAVEHGV